MDWETFDSGLISGSKEGSPHPLSCGGRSRFRPQIWGTESGLLLGWTGPEAQGWGSHPDLLS